MEPTEPLLVRVLAGNSVTGATIFAYLDIADTIPLRQLHPAVAGAVADVPWCDKETRVHDVVRWRAALPACSGGINAERLACTGTSAGGTGWCHGP